MLRVTGWLSASESNHGITSLVNIASHNIMICEAPCSCFRILGFRCSVRLSGRRNLNTWGVNRVESYDSIYWVVQGFDKFRVPQVCWNWYKLCIARLLSQSPRYFARQTLALVSQTYCPPTSITWLQPLRKQTNTDTSTALYAEIHWSTRTSLRALSRLVTSA